MRSKIFTLVFSLLIGLTLYSNAVNLAHLSPWMVSDSSCAEIILKNGDIINAAVSKITETTIVYRKCGTERPVYEISKEKVLMIKYADGKTEKYDISSNTGQNTGKTGGIIAFGFSVLGLLIFPWLFGLTGLIWGIISLNKMIKTNTKGKGWPIAAIAIGAFDVIVVFILLALLAL